MATAKYNPDNALLVHYGEAGKKGRRLGRGVSLLPGFWGTMALLCEDFDGDGDVDLVVSLDSFSLKSWQNSTLRKSVVDILSLENLGNRVFGPPTRLNVPDVCYKNAYVSPPPLSGASVRESSPRSLRYMRANPSEYMSSKSGPEAMFSADFDVDGLPDVAFICRRGDLVAWIPSAPPPARQAPSQEQSRPVLGRGRRPPSRRADRPP